MKPSWLTIRPSKESSERINKLRDVLGNKDIHSVCQESHCPNMSKCWGNGTVAFLIMGEICTRNCHFCNVKTGRPCGLDKEEPKKVAETAEDMGLDYVVLSSVDRDDLDDKGASHFAECIRELKKRGIRTEVLIPDYGREELKIVIDAGPVVISHHIETVERLSSLRDRRAGYNKSLETLGLIKELSQDIYSKSSLMLGFGEKEEEVESAMEDLRKRDVDMLTMGQYLQPLKDKAEIKRYVTPEEFDNHKEKALKIGFKRVASGPFVRGSFRAKEMFESLG